MIHRKGIQQDCLGHVKIAVFAPMPRANEVIAMAVIAGLFRSIRIP
jgi:hypothetical protein